ncbi:MAG: hypothetical protein ACE37B_11815 [Ilumatobacter sp.]|uniref:hypothetical protein n=1 Tax=Ilumatobacter sp. TaxID=1967498 RepID=UPI0039197014
MSKTKRSDFPSPAHDPSFSDRESVIRNVDVINGLRGHLLGATELPSDISNKVSPGAFDYLSSDEGREMVGKWFAAFASTIGLVQQARNELVHGATRPSDEDLREVADASTHILESLFVRADRKSR